MSLTVAAALMPPVATTFATYMIKEPPTITQIRRGESSQKPLPPTAGDDPRYTFTATITETAPTGTALPNVWYVFTGQPELTGFHSEASVGTPDNHNISILGCNIGFTIFAALVVALRIFTRTTIIKAIGIDDGLILLALCAAFGIMSLNIVAVHYRMGYHAGDITSDNLSQVQKYHWLAQIVYCVCLGATKLSMLSFVLRLHPSGAFKWFRYLIFGCFLFVFGHMANSLVLTIKMCWPIAGIYDNTIISICLNKKLILFTLSSLNIFTDVLIVCLPIPMVIRAHIPKKQKVALFVVFMMGLLVCVASAVRMTTLDILTDSGDPSWVMARFSIWTAIEYDLAIICASIPTLKPFITKILPGILSSKLVTMFYRRVSYLRSSKSKFSSLRESVKVSAGKDGSIQMNSMGGVSDGGRWTGKVRGDGVEVTTTKAFYSEPGVSEECMVADGMARMGIVKTVDIAVMSEEGIWDPESKHNSLEVYNSQESYLPKLEE